MPALPFYDPSLSYEENYAHGPFGSFAENVTYPQPDATPRQTFLGLPVFSTFGIPAGPLLNSRFVAAAFRHGFDLCVYKTVRSRALACWPFPNTLEVEFDGDLALRQTVRAHRVRDNAPRTITNSFGVPSQSQDVWQPDMQAAIRAVGVGQIMIGSFQGSGEGDAQVADYALAAKLVAETDAPVIEANLSCPNEGKTGLLCFDVEKVVAVVNAIKSEVNDRPLLLKLAYFEDDALLASLVQAIGSKVEGLCAVNTLQARVVDAAGHPALPGRDISGVCGAAIRWAGLSMTKRLHHLRTQYKMRFVIVANGGVLTPQDDRAYRTAGADAVMSATGAMWNPMLAQEIKYGQ
jgi:Dihydroorotate dehydrogenase